MDLSKAKSIYNRAIAVKISRNTAEAEAVSSEYLAFQKENPDLPRVEFIPFNYDGSIIQPSSPKWADPINRIIKALEPYVCKPNDDEFYTAEIPEDIGLLKGPFTMEISRNQESVRRIEKKNLEIKRTLELSQFLDSILKEAKFMETEWLEFKTIFLRDRYDYLGRIFSSLSNTARLYNLRYAYLIYGINELKREISGTNFNTSSNTWQVIEQELHQRFTPSIKFEILEFNYNDDPQKHIVVFRIHAASDSPITYCGQSFIRHGDRTVPLNNFPNYQNVFLNSTQQTVVNNNITIIIQNPQIIFNINAGNTNINSNNNVNSNNNIDDSPNTNIGSNNQTTTLKESDYNSNKLDIKWIIGIIIAIIAIPFSGFAVKSCNSDEKNMAANSATIGNQNNQLNQHSQIIINGNNNTITNSNNAKTVNNQTYNSSVETSTQSIVSDSTMNELCLLYSRAIAIKTGKFQAGILTALMDDFNTFARKYTLDEVKPCIKIDAGAGRINKCGVDRLEKIKHRLNVFKMNHKINCNF